MRHDCGRTANGWAWTHCSVCNGRIHEPGCTSRRNRLKDCCKARHEMLAAQGHTFGLADSSQPMIGTHSEA